MGFTEDGDIVKVRSAFQDVQNQKRRAISTLKHCYKLMRNLKYTLQQSDRFSAQHVSELEAQYDDFKVKLQNLLDNSPENLPTGSHDILNPQS